MTHVVGCSSASHPPFLYLTCELRPLLVHHCCSRSGWVQVLESPSGIRLSACFWRNFQISRIQNYYKFKVSKRVLMLEFLLGCRNSYKRID